jgi:acetyl esterase/lipase
MTKRNMRRAAQGCLAAAALLAASPAGADCTIPTHVKEKLYTKMLNLYYTTQPNAQQSLNLYVPTKVANPPVLITIHGGAFEHGDDITSKQFAIQMTTFGIAVATVNYRLFKGQTNVYPAGISDVRCAASWLAANAATLGIDGTRFAVYGGSAGGNFSGLLGLAADPNGKFDGTPNCAASYPPPPMLGVADYFGLNEIQNPAAMNRYQTKVSERYLDVPNLKHNEALAAEASPITYVTPGAVPFFIARGTLDNTMPEQQATDMVAALQAAGVTEQYWDIPGLGHGFQPLDIERYPQLQESGCALIAFYQGVFGISQ